MNKRKAFTLVEVVIALAIFSLLLTGIYQVFIGGSKTAGKGQWINNTVDQMRNALSLISAEIRKATYPTTMFKNTIYDPCDNNDKKVPAKYYLRILKDGTPINVPSSDKIKIMDWCVCSSEKPEDNEKGKFINHQLYLVYKTKTANSITGDLVLKTESFDYTTDSKNNYARSGKIYLTPRSSETREKTLVNDVESVEFIVGGKINPQKPLDFLPISVKIRTLYSKDIKVFKENSIMATPQVAIDLL
jgi:prepilin-type N-terminal cleavage/methylation domain-containing protein